MYNFKFHHNITQLLFVKEGNWKKHQSWEEMEWSTGSMCPEQQFCALVEYNMTCVTACKEKCVSYILHKAHKCWSHKNTLLHAFLFVHHENATTQ